MSKTMYTLASKLQECKKKGKISLRQKRLDFLNWCFKNGYMNYKTYSYNHDLVCQVKAGR
jgi:hypothetical protein